MQTSCRYINVLLSQFLFCYERDSITNGIVSSEIYDKWDDFNFEIVNFQFFDGDVPRSLPMVYIFRS